MGQAKRRRDNPKPKFYRLSNQDKHELIITDIECLKCSPAYRLEGRRVVLLWQYQGKYWKFCYHCQYYSESK